VTGPLCRRGFQNLEGRVVTFRAAIARDDRQGHHEAGTFFARPVLDPDASFVCFHESSDQIEADSGTGLIVTSSSPETIEDCLLLLVGDAGTLIGDFHSDGLVSVEMGGDVDRSVGGAVLGCVFDQIDQYLAEAVGIGAFERQNLVHVEGDCPAGIEPADEVGCFDDDRSEIHPPESEVEHSDFHLRGDEEVGDQGFEVCRFATDEVYELGCLSVDNAIGQEVAEPDDRRQRCP